HLGLSFDLCCGGPKTRHSFPTRRSSDLCSPSTMRWSKATDSVVTQRGTTSSPPLVSTTQGRRWMAPMQKIADSLPLMMGVPPSRSEEHTSELQSRENLVCRLLLAKKNHS